MWVSRCQRTATAAALALALSSAGANAAESKKGSPATSEPVAEASESMPELSESTKAERALARKPTDRAARLRAARAQLAEGAESSSRVETAQQHALAVLSESPRDIEALLLAGQTSLLKGDPGNASRYYRAATLADPNNSTAALGLGDALTRLGDEAGATAAFARYRALMGMPALQSDARRK